MTIDLHSYTAPYALDALEPLERARFEAHLESCDDCRKELAGFAATAGQIGESMGQTPPPMLRDRLLAEIANTPQQSRTVIDQPGRFRRAIPRLAVAAAVLVGGFGAGGYVMEHQRAEDLSVRNVAISTVLGADDAATQTKTFDTGGTVRMVSSVSNDSAVVVAHGLPPLDDDKVYQMWMIDADGPRAEGTFTTSGTSIMTGLSTAARIAVTVAPAGGSKQPTSAPIATLAV